MGVWIETLGLALVDIGKDVTPFVGVWIETGVQSLNAKQRFVTPFVGVWIETCFQDTGDVIMDCHTLRGCVD